MQNQDGNWSHWSEPSEFVTSAAASTSVVDSLRITELHYHPADPTPAELTAGFDDQDDFEFIELMNIGAQTIRLANTSFEQVLIDGETQGLDFTFPTDRELAPGERIVVVEDIDAFAMRYGNELIDNDTVIGQWSGGLDNKTELIRLLDDGAVIHEFAYHDDWHVTTDGDGYSLEIVDPTAELTTWATAEAWQANRILGGTPGTSDATDPIGGDFDTSGQVDAVDIDLLFAALRTNDTAPMFDLNDDGEVSSLDADFLIRGILKSEYGDFDLDGSVGFSDFLLLASAFGGAGDGWEQGDANGDEMVDFADFLILSSNFGK